MSNAKQVGWRFSATDRKGQTVSGSVQATTEDEAIHAVTEQNLMPMSVERTKPLKKTFQFRRSVEPKALTVFTRQFATLVDSALPLLTSLEMLSELTDDSALRAALTQAVKDVRGGTSLSGALEAHPKVFDAIYVHMVQAGEVGGTLPESLNRIADYMEESQGLRERVVGAMIYPFVVLGTAVIAVTVILTFVVPIFGDLFAAEGIALPFSTRILLAASGILIGYWPLLIVTVVVLAAAAYSAFTSTSGRRVIDIVLIRLPLVGELARKAAVARATRAMASLVRSGVTLSDTLLASARVSGNAEVGAAFLAARDAIQGGSDLATPLGRSPVLPKLLTQMVKVGEESGRLEEMLAKVADFFEMEVKSAIDGAMKALEPALVVLLGVLLGGIIVGMYLPIFDLMTSIG